MTLVVLVELELLGTVYDPIDILQQALIRPPLQHGPLRSMEHFEHDSQFISAVGPCLNFWDRVPRIIRPNGRCLQGREAGQGARS
jgi:hypothetical protein